MDIDPTESRQSWLIAVISVMEGLALLSVALRLISRRIRAQKLWWDDWLIILSMVWSLGVAAEVYYIIHLGLGRHSAVVSENLVRISQLVVAGQVLYVFNLVWSKVGLLLLYYRIFRFANVKRWSYLIGGFVFGWAVIMTFLFCFVCVPLEKLWNPAAEGYCIDQVATWIANAASTILTDLMILVLPLPAIWKLQLSWREKYGLLVAFTLGFL